MRTCRDPFSPRERHATHPLGGAECGIGKVSWAQSNFLGRSPLAPSRRGAGVGAGASNAAERRSIGAASSPARDFRPYRERGWPAGQLFLFRFEGKVFTAPPGTPRALYWLVSSLRSGEGKLSSAEGRLCGASKAAGGAPRGCHRLSESGEVSHSRDVTLW